MEFSVTILKQIVQPEDCISDLIYSLNDPKGVS